MGNEMNWDFTVDSELQLEISDKIKERADQFDEKITKLYGQIDSMGSNKYWVGEDYDAFKTGCDGYKGALSDLSDSFRMFADHLVKISDGTVALADELNNIIANLTSRHVGNNSGLLDVESFTASTTSNNSIGSN